MCIRDRLHADDYRDERIADAYDLGDADRPVSYTHLDVYKRQTSYNVSVTGSGGFSSAVTLSVSGLPTGANASFSPNPATGASTLSVTTGATTPTASYTLTITGTSGSLTHTTSVTLIVNSAPDFAIGATPPTQTVAAGSGTTYNVSLTGSGGFSSAVTLSVSGLPTGANASFSPNPATGASTLSVTTGATTASGNYTLTITGTSGTLTHTTQVMLSIQTPDFTLSATPPSQNVSAGTNAIYSIAIGPSGGFSSAVNLTLTGLPANTTYSFSPNPSTGGSTLTVSTTAATPSGAFPLTVTGTSGSLSHSAGITLVVGSNPDFSLALAPANRTILPGSITTYGITVQPTGGFAGSVSFSVSGLPNGALGILSPNPSATSATLTVYTSASAANGTYPFVITGTSGNLTRTVPGTLVLGSGPDYSLAATPQVQSVIPGANTSYSISITGTGGFASAVSFVVSGLPANTTASFSPNPANGSTTLTVNTTSTTPLGSYPLTITGTSGALTRLASATLNVNGPPDFSISAGPVSQSVTPGGSTTYTMTITPVNGFNGPVSFTANGLPSTASATFSPNPASGASTLTITTTTAIQTGTYPFTITGTSGSLTHSTPASLTVASAPDFGLSMTPPFQSIPRGSLTMFSLTVTPMAGFSSPVSLSVTGLPNGVLAIISPNPAPSGAVTLTIWTSYTAPAGSYPFTVTGTGGGMTHSTGATLVLN